MWTALFSNTAKACSRGPGRVTVPVISRSPDLPAGRASPVAAAAWYGVTVSRWRSRRRSKSDRQGIGLNASDTQAPLTGGPLAGYWRQAGGRCTGGSSRPAVWSDAGASASQ